VSTSDYEQDPHNLRVEGALKAFERVRGVDKQLDSALDANDWPLVRARLNEIEQSSAGAIALVGKKDVALLHFSIPILLTLIEDF